MLKHVRENCIEWNRERREWSAKAAKSNIPEIATEAKRHAFRFTNNIQTLLAS